VTANYRSLSLWHDTYPGPLEPRLPLADDTQVDVAIVGGGYTGLWTAYYLLRMDPSLRIVVIEKEIVGFGASGRNGGWCVGELAAGRSSRAGRRQRCCAPLPRRVVRLRRRGRARGGTGRVRLPLRQRGHDPWGFQDRHTATFPNHEGIVVPKGWHFPMTVDLDLFVDTVRDWWQRKVTKQTI